MRKLKLLDLFSGIGGFSLGLESTGGFETVAFCEFDKHARLVLNKHWPEIKIHEDVRVLDGRQYRGTVDVVCGGFPCQDVSVAGKKKGITEGERSNLYVEMLRIISECLPRYAIFENVTGLLTGESGKWFAKFLYDLDAIGYDAEWHCISASFVGAHHHRDRIWIIAYPKSLQCNGKKIKTRERTPGEICEPRGCSGADDLANTNSDRSSPRLATKRQYKEGYARIAEYLSIEIGRAREEQAMGRWATEPSVGRVAHGVQDRSHRLKQLGNSVVPLIPKVIGQAILNYESKRS